MFFHVQDDVQVARGTAERSSFAVPGKANACPVFHTGRNLRFHRPLSQYASLAFALRARIGDNAPRALTCRTRASHRKKSLLVTDLAPALAGTAGYRRLARSGTRTRAILAGFVPTAHYLGLFAENPSLELQCKVLTQSRTLLR